MRQCLESLKKTIPSNPGIYMMLDKNELILYIGKARNLKKRIASYFFKKSDLDLKTTYLVSKISDIKTIVTKTEQEALLLEKQLVKKHQPKYNIDLKDDKNFPYIIVTSEPFPRVKIDRQKPNNQAACFGPYTSLGSTRKYIQFLNDLFPLRRCKKIIDLKIIQKKCIYCDIDKCLAPCVNKNIRETYLAFVKDLKALLAGKNRGLQKSFARKMKQYSNTKQYEKAAQMRDQIQKIETLTEKQTVVIDSHKNIQVWAEVENDEYCYVLVQSIIEGKLLSQNGYYLKRGDTLIKEGFFMESMLKHFQDNEYFPDEIICRENYKQCFEELLSIKTKRATISIPIRGQKKELLENAEKNAQVSMLCLHRNSDVKEIKDTAVIDLVKTTLALKNYPTKIVGFDISHLQGTDIVGSAVSFVNAKPNKVGYKRFNIKSVAGKSNDPAAIAEIVYRYLSNIIGSKKELPDLLLIDGGKGQLNFAKKEEELFQPGISSPIKLKESDPVRLLLQRVRDESHRFAVSFQRIKRKSRIEDSLLSKVDGIGPKRINKIYKTYKNLDNLVQADTIGIAKALGIGVDLAAAIKRQVIEKD